MRRRIRPRYRVGLAAFVALAAMALFTSGASAIVAGAGFTTFDVNQGGCNGAPNGVNCNNYASKDDVYVTGGPTAGGLSDGSYYFAVLTPGSQNGGFVDGASGNLSDTAAGGTAGDNGSGDPVACRTFTVTSQLISDYSPSATDCADPYAAHAVGTSTPETGSKAIIQLSPYDDTDNPGGVYILAICQVGATSASQCKYDAFKAPASNCVTDCTPPPFADIQGQKYYDANANGRLDTGEVGISGWQINLQDSLNETLTTDTSGNFDFQNLAPDTYTLAENKATNQKCVTEVISSVSTLVCDPIWVQTGNTTDQSDVSLAPGSTVTLNTDKTYTVVLGDTGTVSGIRFGNICVGGGGGLTIGFWSNKNGQKLVTAADLTFLSSNLNLVDGKGNAFNPTTYAAFRTWLLNAKATNMAYMLSAQLAGMELNVRHGFVSASALIYAPGTTSANASGFAAVGDVMTEANTSLGTNPYTVKAGAVRTYQEALKNALDRANNNLNFVQSGPANCPTPTFAP
jgi:hypothetical protein